MKFAFAVFGFLFLGFIGFGPLAYASASRTQALAGVSTSKFLGALEVNLKIEAPTLPVEASPHTFADVERDNGQIVSMNCVTAATFPKVTTLSIRVVNAGKVLTQKKTHVDVLVADSYPMATEDEICQPLPLFNSSKAVVANSLVETEVKVSLGGDTLTLRVSGLPFPSPLAASTVAKGRRLVLEHVDFSRSPISNPTWLNFSLSQDLRGGTTYLEHGTIELVAD